METAQAAAEQLEALLRTRSWRAAEELIAQIDRRLADKAPRSRVAEYEQAKQRVKGAISASKRRYRLAAIILLIAIGAWVVQRQQGVVAVRELRFQYNELEAQAAGFTTPIRPELTAAQTSAEKSLSALEDSASWGLWWQLSTRGPGVGQVLSVLQHEIRLERVHAAEVQVRAALESRDCTAAQAALVTLQLKSYPTDER